MYLVNVDDRIIQKKVQGEARENLLNQLVTPTLHLMGNHEVNGIYALILLLLDKRTTDSLPPYITDNKEHLHYTASLFDLVTLQVLC